MTEPDLAEVEAYAKAQEAEYGAYVANQPISLHGIRAFNTGDPVPAGHVARGVVERDQVISREEYDQRREAADSAATGAAAAAPSAPAAKTAPPPSNPVAAPAPVVKDS